VLPDDSQLKRELGKKKKKKRHRKSSYRVSADLVERTVTYYLVECI
jgi:hypothetical protein